ncbi:hypothetical protein [Candidatus Nitrosocosmicus sp. SS]|nr:hypothetical protein [Candidatus Nitrosocosmicus sp. SS]MDR4489537.1 hypothetical protein [Candidatus Nitrosocosmicus sp.]
MVNIDESLKRLDEVYDPVTKVTNSEDIFSNYFGLVIESEVEISSCC